jgi:hypothetical protein
VPAALRAARGWSLAIALTLRVAGVLAPVTGTVPLARA